VTIKSECPPPSGLHWWIRCDEPGCKTRAVFTDRSYEQTLEAAQILGWKIVHDSDGPDPAAFCREHATNNVYTRGRESRRKATDEALRIAESDRREVMLSVLTVLDSALAEALRALAASGGSRGLTELMLALARRADAIRSGMRKETKS
jgi:hypothetical protein